MSKPVDGMPKVEPLFRRAIGCSFCFICQGSQLTRALVDIAQPRPIGEAYWTSRLRITLILLNPGSGKVAHAGPNHTFKRLLHAYAQRIEMPGWGNGLFRRLYLEGYGLKLNEIATANVAWCAERDDQFQGMLAPCFDRHSLPLIIALNPDVVLLAGEKTWAFKSAIELACPEVEVVPTLHYIGFNRLPALAKPIHLADVRARLDRIRQAKRTERAGAGAPGGTQALGTDQTTAARGTEPSLGVNAAPAAYANREPVSIRLTEARAVPENAEGRHGAYRIVDERPILRRAGNREDPRWEFYDAMLKLNKYDDYYSRFGDKKVYPATYQSSPRTAKTEMRWALKQGWIADV